ncbi:MAG: hypothetical protein V1874_07925 [Spirochaetota bacterium]
MRLACVFRVSKLVVLIVILFINNSFAQNEKKLSIFVQNIDVKDVPQKYSELAIDSIKTAITEQYGQKYTMADKESLASTMSNEELKQAYGCDDEKCRQKIAEQLRTDFTITGKIYRDANQDMFRIALNLNDKSGKTIRINYAKCHSNQVEYYSKELTKSLFNPQYKVREAGIGDISSEGIIVGTLKMQKVKDLDISIMKFTTTDRFINDILPMIKDGIRKGDERYELKDYNNALENYNKTLNTVTNDIPPDKVTKDIEILKEKIQQRIGTVIYAQFAARVEETDRKVNAAPSPKLDQMEKFKELYSIILHDLNRTELAYKTNNINILINQVNNRHDLIAASIVNHYSALGAASYNSQKFTEAIAYYNKAIASSVYFIDQKKTKTSTTQLNRKIEIVNKAGQDFLANRVYYFIDSALTFNVFKNYDKMKSTMADAAMLIKENEAYSTGDLIVYYNGKADFLNQPKYTSSEELNRKRIQNEQLRISQQKRKDAIEANKKSYGLAFFYSILPVTSGMAYGLDNNGIGIIPCVLKITGLLVCIAKPAVGLTIYGVGAAADLVGGINFVSFYNKKFAYNGFIQDSVSLNIEPILFSNYQPRDEKSLTMNRLDGLRCSVIYHF